MFNKYLLTLYFLILIAIFIYLFNIAKPAIESDRLLAKSEELFETRILRFARMMTQADKEDIKKLPCSPRNTKFRCPQTDIILKNLKDSIEGGAVINVELVNQHGVSLFTRERSDRAYLPVLEKAKENNISQIVEYERKNGEQYENLRTYVDILQYSGEEEFENVYLVSTLDKSQIRASLYPIYFLIFTLFLLPIALIALKIVRTERFSEVSEAKYQKTIINLEKKIEKLKHENVQQSQFLANFTHELRTPLNSIIGFSGLIKDETLGSLGNEEYGKYASDINNSGVHLLSLINDILDYSKAEVGRLKINMADSDIIKVIKQCFSIIAPRANESGVDMLQSFSQPYCVLKIDQKRFKQVILNLLSNSVKFTPENGSVTVSVFNDIKQERLYIEVKDTGVGIEEKDIPTVMALFGQVETDLNRNYEGTGIGLPFAKKLTNLMGGTFEISSKVGLGTRITLGFPWDKRINAQYQDNFR